MVKVPIRLSGLGLLVVGWSLVTATNAAAELTDKAGADYATLCDMRGVPLPPPFGGPSNPWTRSGQLTVRAGNPQSFNTNGVADIFYYKQTQTTSPQGLCMAAAFADSAVGGSTTTLFGVICQGLTGKVCFWDQATSFPWNPTTNTLATFPNPVTITSKNPNDLVNAQWVGGMDLVNDENGTCSNCHSGANAFNNHPGTATDLLGRGLVTSQYWFPSQWPDPIVPIYDASSNPPGAWPQNPGPGKPFAGSACMACHQVGLRGGAFPTLSNRLGDWCGTVLGGATSRLNNLCLGTWNPFSGGDITCPTGAMPPSNTATTTNSSMDPYVQNAMTVACQAAPLALGAACGAGPECGSLVCTAGHCARPTCSPTCGETLTCGDNGDCLSGMCLGNVCQPCSGACPGPALRINCGNNGAIPPFVADEFFTNGAGKTRLNTIDLTGAVNPAPMAVYQSQRYASPFSYTIPGFVAGSSHLIRLHFAETNPNNNAPNRRKFSVAINGTTQISNLDLYATVGLNHAYIKEFTLPANSSGKYVLSFTASLDSATISGIEVQ
jgi:hypothetical protein